MPDKLTPETQKTVDALRHVVEKMRSDFNEDLRSLVFRLERVEDEGKVELYMTELRRKMRDVRKQFERIDETAKKLGGEL